MALAQIPADILNLVLDFLEIWDLYSLSRTSRYFRGKVNRHGLLITCQRLRRAPRRTQQFVANRMRCDLQDSNLTLGSMWLDETSVMVHNEITICLPPFLIFAGARSESFKHGASIMIRLSWAEQPPTFDEPNILVRYFILHDRVFIRFGVGKYPEMPTTNQVLWMRAMQFLRHAKEYGIPILHFAVNLASRIRPIGMPYFPEAVEPILHKIDKYRLMVKKEKNTIYEDMPALSENEDFSS